MFKKNLEDEYPQFHSPRDCRLSPEFPEILLGFRVKDRVLNVDYVFENMTPNEICMAGFAELKGSGCSSMVLYCLYKLMWAISDEHILTPASSVVLILAKLVKTKCSRICMLDIYRYCTIVGPSKIHLSPEFYEVICDEVASVADNAETYRDFCSELLDPQLDFFKRIGFTANGFVKTMKRHRVEEGAATSAAVPPPLKKPKTGSPPPALDVFQEKMDMAEQNSRKFLQDIADGKPAAFEVLDHYNFFQGMFGYNGFQNVLGKDILYSSELQENITKTMKRIYLMATLSKNSEDFQKNVSASIFGGNPAGRRIGQLVGRSHFPQLFNSMCQGMGQVGQAAEGVCKRIAKWQTGVDKKEQIKAAVDGGYGQCTPADDTSETDFF